VEWYAVLLVVIVLTEAPMMFGIADEMFEKRDGWSMEMIKMRLHEGKGREGKKEGSGRSFSIRMAHSHLEVS
jgi:hypothetical protein